MDEMLDAYYQFDANITHLDSNVQDRQQNPQDRQQNPQEEQIEPEEEVMRKLARLPLYGGAKISVLRASLAMLNLESGLTLASQHSSSKCLLIYALMPEYLRFKKN